MKILFRLGVLFFIMGIVTSCGGDDDDDNNNDDDMMEGEIFTLDIVMDQIIGGDIVSSTASAHIWEGETANFTVSLDRPNNTGTRITILFDIDGSATSSEDFEALSGILTIQDGESEATFSISIVQDNFQDASEQINLTFTNDSRNEIEILEPVFDLIITDTNGGDDMVVVDDFEVFVGENMIEPLRVRVSWADLLPFGELTMPITVTYEVSGTADPGEYEPLEGDRFTLTRDTPFFDFEILPLPDNEDEEDETIIITLTDILETRAIAIGPSPRNMALITIID